MKPKWKINVHVKYKTDSSHGRDGESTMKVNFWRRYQTETERYEWDSERECGKTKINCPDERDREKRVFELICIPLPRWSKLLRSLGVLKTKIDVFIRTECEYVSGGKLHTHTHTRAFANSNNNKREKYSCMPIISFSLAVEARSSWIKKNLF